MNNYFIYYLSINFYLILFIYSMPKTNFISIIISAFPFPPFEFLILPHIIFISFFAYLFIITL